MDYANRQGPVTMHMVGNAHIDPVWLWPLSEGRAEVLSTYRTAIARGIAWAVASLSELTAKKRDRLARTT